MDLFFISSIFQLRSNRIVNMIFYELSSASSPAKRSAASFVKCRIKRCETKRSLSSITTNTKSGSLNCLVFPPSMVLIPSFMTLLSNLNNKYYAIIAGVKCNDNCGMVLEVLASLGASFDCAPIVKTI